MASKFLKLMMILVAASSLAACSQKSTQNSLSGRGGSTPGGIVGGSGGYTPNCGTSQQSMGRVYDNGSGGGYTFDQRAKLLISATVDPQFFGTISGNTNDAQSGVTMEGRLSYDTNGNVIVSQTSIKLMIYDSFVGQVDSSGKTIQPYPINFSTAFSGTMNLATKQFTIQFKDNFGQITVTGVVNGATTTGTISFQNTTSYNGTQAASGVLGAFTIPTCGWVQ